MLLAACCLSSVGHLDAVQPNRPGGKYALYKARVLREVSKRMQTPSTATSDETIGTLSCLLSFEISRCSGEALTHLRGLRSIIKMRGGLDTMTFSGISRMLETLDLLHAAIFDCKPLLTSPDMPASVTLADLEVSEAQAFARLIPLLAAEQEDFQKMNSTYSATLRQLPDLLASAVHLLNDELHSSLRVEADTKMKATTPGGNIIADFKERLDRFGQLGFEEHPDFFDAHHLARACHLNFVIFYNLVIHRLPHRHRSNQKYADALFFAIRGTKERTWEGISYLRLWILLTGAVASNDVSQKSFFKAQLVRSIFQMGAKDFRRVKDFMLTYLELKQVMESPDRQASPPLELETPTCADTSYLYASWPDSRRSSSPGSMVTTLGSNSPCHAEFTSCNPSPVPLSAPIALPILPARLPSLYDDIDTDPFLDCDALPSGPGGIVSDANATTAADLFASDRTFHQAIYDGELWFMHIES